MVHLQNYTLLFHVTYFLGCVNSAVVMISFSIHSVDVYGSLAVRHYLLSPSCVQGTLKLVFLTCRIHCLLFEPS